MTDIVSKINDFFWGIPMIIFLVGAHLYLTYRTGFVQRKIFKGIRLSVRKEENGSGDVSIFAALSTALASTVGTGNIIGVGTAVTLGGPGAVLWTWIGGIFGIATKYAETYIAVKHRQKKADGSYVGGAMTALDHLKKPFLSKFFCFATIFGAFGIGCLTQSNAISSLVRDNFSIPTYICGIVIAVITFIIVVGGIRSIANVCTKLVPFMSLVYVLGCIYILFINASYLPETISLIISSAFTAKAIGGGFVGSTLIIAMRYGVARGLFSNEAGMGSAPIASAAGEAKNAVKPALIGATGVFWDTVVICLMTGLVLCSCVLANPGIDAAVINDGSKLCTAAFSTIPVIGAPLLIFGVLTFAYSTILGWCYYATQCVEYLFSSKMTKIYMFVWIIVIFLGSIGKIQVVWDIADILNALMVIPNIIAVLLLSKEMAKDTGYYLYQDHLEERDESLL
ncbi:MAG: sodium:alanine symporter family protein [Erysipelotrichaceae bacterium]|nr:sodium:alanine symporter family protein [Erysipelotrichaceae bacterium]